MRTLYGTRYHGRSGHLSLKTWKRQLLLLFKTIREALDRNITGDEHHNAQMMELCEQAMQVITDDNYKDQINSDALLFAFRLIFEILGSLPNNWNRRIPRHRRVTDLSAHRTLVYARSATQRAREIIDAAYLNKLKPDDPKFEVLIDKLKRGFRDDPHKFLKWIKAEHPSLYQRFE